MGQYLPGSTRTDNPLPSTTLFRCLEHAGPGRPWPPQEPGERHGDDHREGGRERREADRGEERATPAVVGEDLGIPVERQTFRRKQQALLLVQRHAEDDDERRHEEQRNQRHIARSEERRVRKECVRTCRFRWSLYH